MIAFCRVDTRFSKIGAPGLTDGLICILRTGVSVFFLGGGTLDFRNLGSTDGLIDVHT